MPKFLKNDALVLLNGGVEAYVLGLYGLYIPSVTGSHQKESKYAPIMGLFGATTELIVKACLVQAKGLGALYANEDISKGVYRFGNETIDDFRGYIKHEDSCISYIWVRQEDHQEQKNQLLHYLGKFKLLQTLRASGLHAGRGCSKDIVITTANDIYEFTKLLSLSKKLRPYLKSIPVPESTIRDREAIFEDFTRRYRTAKDLKTKTDLLRGMYLVLPYMPEITPDWINGFDKIAVAPPNENDLTYLSKTLTDAHSIYLLKNRGGKEGIPVRVEQQNLEAIPISIQNIKRALNSMPDKFNNDVLSANSRLEEGRLDLPIDDILNDYYILGLKDSGILVSESLKLTAQQLWPFVASAYSTNGTPRPCWFMIQTCDEIDKLITYLERAEKIGNGYLRRRMPQLISSLEAIKANKSVSFECVKDDIFTEISKYKERCKKISINPHPFTPEFLLKNLISQNTINLVHEYVVGNIKAGDCLAKILEQKDLVVGDKKVCIALLPYCFKDEDKNGLMF